MAEFNDKFWELIAEEGHVAFEDLPSRIGKVLTDHPNLVQLENVDTTVVYSGGYGGAGMTPAAQDLASRSAGTIGIIDETKTGQALGNMVDEFYADPQAFESKYSNYIDFEGYDFQNAPPEARKEFLNKMFENFEPASNHFASHAKGNIITMTPASDVSRVYAQQEIPKIVEGMLDGRITEINGRSVAEFDELLKPFRDPDFKPSLDPDNYSYQAIKDQFDGDFRANVKSQGLDFHSDATRTQDGGFNRDATRTVLDADQADIRNLGASENVRVDAPDLNGLNAHDINGLKAGRARLSSADELGELRGFAATPDGSTSYLIDTKNSTIYTVTGDDLTGVQKFDSSKDAGQAYGRLLGEAADASPDAFKGLPKVHNSLGSLTKHIDDLGRAPWRKALGAFGDGAAEFGGKASKILGPLGVAAAAAEVYGLEMKLQDYEEFGLVSEDAMLAYRGILTAHTAQATVDPSLVGGEVAVQVAHDQWAKAYGIDDNVKEALEPGSLLEDVGDAAKWLGDQAEAAGMAVKDYAVSRWNDPGKLGEDWDAIKDAAESAAIAAGETITYAADVIVDTAEVVGDYAEDRFENPEKLLDDAAIVGNAIQENAEAVGEVVLEKAEAVGNAIEEKADAIGNSISNGVKDAWNYLFGDDSPGETSYNVPETVPFGEAVQQFSVDREALNTMDPQHTLAETQLAHNPEAEAMFLRLNETGIARFPADALTGETPQARIGGVLKQAHTIDRDLAAEHSQEQELETTQDLQYAHADDYDYSAMG